MMRGAGRWGAALGALIAGAGCEQLGSIANPEVPLWVHHPGAALTVEGRRELTIKRLNVGEAYERATPEIDPPHRRIFIGSSDYGLYALNAGNLSTQWRFQTGGAVSSKPLYVTTEDAVYFGSNDGAMYKLRAADGKMLWRFASNAEIIRRPVLAGRTLYFVNANDTLVALDADNGKLRWFRQRTPAFGMEISGYAGPTVHGGLVYAAFSDGVVMAYRLDDGSEAWGGPVDLTAEAEQTGNGEELRYLDVDTTPLVFKSGGDELLIVASYEGGLFALDAKTGSQVWRNDKATGVTELTMWSGRPRRTGSAAQTAPVQVLVASSGLSGLWGINPQDGSERWRRELPTGGVTGAEPWAGALLIGTTRYGMFLVHPLDGAVMDGIAAGGSFAATPAAYGLHAFALSNEGVLVALGIEPPRPPTATP
jgi:outer membrane protein assembly factor BamB